MTFIKRKINLTFSYGTGPDGLGTPKVIELTGHRIICNAVTAGGAGMGQLQLRIYGMTPNLMAELSTIGKLPATYARNIVTVFAGDDVAGMPQIYQGTIFAAYADMMAMPEVAFVVTAHAGMIEALLPTAASSYPSTADAAIIMENLAKSLGLKFENNGVSVILRDQNLPGSGRAQVESCAKAANINWVIDNGTLAIWPKNAYRGTQENLPLISPNTGLVGYPSYTANGLICTILFNPAIRFGALVEVQSTILQASNMKYNGKWSVLVLSHDLSAELPNGPWFSQLQLVRPGVLAIG